MGTYATVAELRELEAVPDAAPPSDEALEELIAVAEDTVDRIIGPRVVGANGRKYDPAAGLMSAARVTALRVATTALAAELVSDPEAFAPALGSSVSGPDFSISNPGAGTPAGQNALRRAAGVLDAVELRVLRAVVR